MSRQKYNVPLGLSPFNYWTLTIAVPIEAPANWSPTVDPASHPYHTTMFRHLVSSTALREQHAASIRAVYRYRGFLCEKDNDLALALGWYVANDTAWQDDATAGSILAGLPSTVRATLIGYDTDRRKRSKPWSWKTLLPRLSLDLTIFRLLLRRKTRQEPLFGDHDPLHGTPLAPLHISQRLVREIYCSYGSCTSSLLGTRFELDGTLLPTFHKLGYCFEDRDQERRVMFPDLQHSTLQRQRRAVVHWFAHAIHNLIQYQHGRPPLLLEACDTTCWRTVKQQRRKILAKRTRRLDSLG